MSSQCCGFGSEGRGAAAEHQHIHTSVVALKSQFLSATILAYVVP